METLYAIAGGVPSLYFPRHPINPITSQPTQNQTHKETPLFTASFSRSQGNQNIPFLLAPPFPKPRLTVLKRIASRGFVTWCITLWSPGDRTWEEKRHLILYIHSVVVLSIYLWDTWCPSEGKGDGTNGATVIDHSDWKWNHEGNKSSLPPLAW